MKLNRSLLNVALACVSAMALLAFALLAVSAAGGSTRYVATTGNDSNNSCKIELMPCRSVAHANAVAQSGDTILIGSGTFTESLTTIGDLEIYGEGATLTTLVGQANDRVFTITGNAVVTIGYMTLSAPTANVVGGCLEVRGGSDATLFKADLTNCRGSFGGAISNRGSLSVESTSVYSNYASSRGGAIYSLGTLVVYQSDLYSNTASSEGGGLYVNEGNAVVSRSSIENNRSLFRSGGGVGLGTDALVSIVDSTITDNSTSTDGGGIASSGTLTVENSLVTGNSAELGGGVYLDSEFESLLHNNSQFSDNRAALGGGIYTTGNTRAVSIMVANNSVVQTDGVSNSGRGGGIYQARNFPEPGIQLLSSAVMSNSAEIYGGGVAIAAQLNGTAILDSEISGNEAKWGGGVYIASSSPVIIADQSNIHHNFYYEAGGGIYNSGELEMSNSSIDNNFYDPDLPISLPAPAGGGLFNWSSAEASLTNVSIRANEANRGAGVANNARLHLDVSFVEGNRPIPSGLRSGLTAIGGGIENSNVLTISGGIVGDNSADLGGGLYNSPNGFVTIDSATIAANRATTGAGIYNRGTEDDLATISLVNSSVLSHTESLFLFGTISDGGGLYNAENGEISVVQSTFSGNIVDNEGGAIFNEGDLLIEWSTLADNTASSGAGILNAEVLNLRYSLLANKFGGDCAHVGTFLSTVSTHLDDGSCMATSSGLVLIGPLANNGGNTLTHALANGSLPIDLGGLTCPTTDQRGYIRPTDGDMDGSATCDLGAVEYASTVPTSVRLSASRLEADSGGVMISVVMLFALVLLTSPLVIVYRTRSYD